MTSLTASLQAAFGFNHFRAGQQLALESLEQGQDTLAILPTGAGKTLIYQLYGYRHPGCVLIVSPLLSLMNDQVDRMRMSGFKRAAAINSLTPFGDRLRILNHLSQLEFLFLSPEMLSQPQMLARLQQIQISLLVVDEAHCIVQWGPDFRPEYLLLGALREALGRPLTLMLTATAGQQTRREIAKQLRCTPKIVTESVNRPNIFLDVENVADEATKQARLQDLVKHLSRPGVVYFSSKQQASDTALWLQQTTGIKAAAYHAGLDAEDRFKIQQQFMTDQLDVICATSAFGMGIDKNNVRFVIHYHLPADLESYAQEIGRAGRDGEPSVAVLLYAPGDEQLPLALSQANRPEPETIQRYYAHPQSFAPDEPQIQLLAFYRNHGISQAAVERLFVRRERERHQALQQMVDYVQSATCLREKWLQAFDETAPNHDSRCCAPSNQALDLAALGLVRQSVQPKISEQLDWSQRLARLF